MKVFVVKHIILAFSVGAVYLYLLCELAGHAVTTAAVFCCFMLLTSKEPMLLQTPVSWRCRCTPVS